MARTLVIAEIGSCHDWRYMRVLELIAAARRAGADVAKFQFWCDPDRLADRRRVPPYYREMYRRYAIPAAWLPDMKGACDRVGIEFMCTTYLPEDVAVVAPLVKRFKVASFEAGAADLREAHRPYLLGRQVIISLGMGAVDDAASWLALHSGVVVEGSLRSEIVEDARSAPARVRFLHCVSAYPAPVEALNLKVLRVGARHGLIHGFSDHTEPGLTWTGALAVAAGAEIIEAHLRLDSTDPQNPDAPHAMNPAQFAEYVQHIRFAETCLGDAGAGRQPCEREMAQYRVRSDVESVEPA